jgi:hypothetical protein
MVKSVSSKDRQCSPLNNKIIIYQCDPKLLEKNAHFCNSRPPSLHLAVKLVALILSHEARDTIRILLSHGRIAEGEWRGATSLWVVLGLELVESDALGEVISKRDIGWQVGAGVERAGSLAAIERGDTGKRRCSRRRC